MEGYEQRAARVRGTSESTTRLDSYNSDSKAIQDEGREARRRGEAIQREAQARGARSKDLQVTAALFG